MREEAWSEGRPFSTQAPVGRAGVDDDDRIARAIEADGVRGIVLCHVSHVYPDGASLYFTFVAPQVAADPLGQWRRIKTAATDAIVEGGGTVTHHHGVGLDHRGWIEREWGKSGVAAVHGLKASLDPQNVMNPGKLFPPESA